METIVRMLHEISYPTVFFVGLIIRLIIGMRQFNRRGIGGLQHFRNYFFGLVTLMTEQILKWIAIALMLWGLWEWLFYYQ